MSAVLVLAGLALLALPGLAMSRGARLQPSEWARLTFASIRVGFRAVQLGLFLTAAPTVLRAVGVHTVADACHRVLGPIMPGGSVTGWVAAVASGLLLAGSALVRRRALRLQRAARVEGWLGAHEEVDGADIVLLPTSAPLAYATPGAPPQVVVSEGLAATLTHEEFDAVVRHELAHIRHRHDRYLVVATVVEATLGWFPGARASTAALRLGVERWADEAAARRPAERDSVRRALLKATETMLKVVPAFTSACTLLARLDALDTDPPAPSVAERAVVVAPIAGLAAVIAGCLLVWSTFTHHGMLGLLGFCPL